MKTAQEIADQIRWVEHAKAVLLQPPQVFVPETMTFATGVSPPPSPGTLESLNAEIAALTWVLSNESASP